MPPCLMRRAGREVRVLQTTEDTRVRMSRQRSRNADVELALRRELHRLGLRYRVHRRPIRAVRREADVVFGPARSKRTLRAELDCSAPRLQVRRIRS